MHFIFAQNIFCGFSFEPSYFKNNVHQSSFTIKRGVHMGMLTYDGTLNTLNATSNVTDSVFAIFQKSLKQLYMYRTFRH